MAMEKSGSLMDPASERAKRGAFFFLMLFAGIIAAAWDLARFVWGGTGIPKEADFGLGIGMGVLMLLSIAPMWAARRKLDRGDETGALGNFSALLIVSLIMLAGIVYGWRAVPIGTGYGGIFDVTSGWLGLYFVGGALALLASVMKGKRVPQRFKDERWVAYNVLSFWGFLVTSWVIFVLIFYVA